MTKQEILEKIDLLASHDESTNYDSFLERYVVTMCYASTSYYEDLKVQELEALKQLYEVYKDCGGLG